MNFVLLCFALCFIIIFCYSAIGLFVLAPRVPQTRKLSIFTGCLIKKMPGYLKYVSDKPVFYQDIDNQCRVSVCLFHVCSTEVPSKIRIYACILRTQRKCSLFI
uniref:Putative secreted protein salivary gland overexpressed n=1 Tax=Rhipicephalus microplus TaxID=6941 RepID=A0A6M2DAX7_RHIMP